MVDELFSDNLSDLSPFYDNFRFIIKTSFKLNELSKQEPENVIKFSEFVHEYCHYLQHLTTQFGMYNLLEWLFLQYQIILDAKRTQELDYTLYFSKYRQIAKQYYYSKGLRKFPNLSERSGYHLRVITKQEDARRVLEAFLYLDAGYPESDRYYHLSPIVLRENMASMIQLMSRGVGDEGVIEVLKDYDCKYYIVYKYFYETYKNVGIDSLKEFTFLFCELALRSLSPAAFAAKLLQDIDARISEFTNTKDFFHRILSGNYDLIEANNVLIVKISETLKNIVDSNASWNVYFDRSNIYLDMIIKSIQSLEENPTVLRYPVNNRWVEKFASIYFSPLIYQPENHLSVLRNIDSFKDCITLIFGVGVVLEMLLMGKEIHTCPFLYEIGICDCDKISCYSICKNEALKIKEFPEGGCVLYNSLLSIGKIRE